MLKRPRLSVRSKPFQFMLAGSVVVIMVVANMAAGLQSQDTQIPRASSSGKASESSKQKDAQQKDSQVTTPSEESASTDTAQEASSATTGQASVVPKATQPSPGSAPSLPTPTRPFGIAGATLYQTYACQSDPNTAYFNIGDVNVSFSAPSGGTLTYRLESAGLENIGSLGLSHTVTVPNGTWSSTLNKLTGTYSGPHQLYAGAVDMNGGGEASVWVVVQAGGDTWTSARIAIPGGVGC